MVNVELLMMVVQMVLLAFIRPKDGDGKDKDSLADALLARSDARVLTFLKWKFVEKKFTCK